jgi:hypothetical protein
MQRDFVYERQQQFKNGKVYDLQANELTLEHNLNVAHFGKDIANRLHMLPPNDRSSEEEDAEAAADSDAIAGASSSSDAEAEAGEEQSAGAEEVNEYLKVVI